MASISGTFSGITAQFELDDAKATAWFDNFCAAKSIALPTEDDPEYAAKYTVALYAVLWELGDYLAQVAKSHKAQVDAEAARGAALADAVWDSGINTRPDRA